MTRTQTQTHVEEDLRLNRSMIDASFLRIKVFVNDKKVLVEECELRMWDVGPCDKKVQRVKVQNETTQKKVLRERFQNVNRFTFIVHSPYLMVDGDAKYF